jgi:hypothetical protein
MTVITGRHRLHKLTVGRRVRLPGEVKLTNGHRRDAAALGPARRTTRDREIHGHTLCGGRLDHRIVRRPCTRWISARISRTEHRAPRRPSRRSDPRPRHNHPDLGRASRSKLLDRQSGRRQTPHIMGDLHDRHL